MLYLPILVTYLCLLLFPNHRPESLQKQLQYIKRNASHIEQLIDSGASLECLNKKQYKTLLVLTEVARQQQCYLTTINRALRIE